MLFPDNLLLPAALAAVIALASLLYLDRRLDRQLLHVHNWTAKRARMNLAFAGTCWFTVVPMALGVYMACRVITSLRDYACLPLAIILMTMLMVIPLVMVRSLALADRASGRVKS